MNLLEQLVALVVFAVVVCVSWTGLTSSGNAVKAKGVTVVTGYAERMLRELRAQ